MSSVRLMSAFGGKRLKGAEKVKRGRVRDLGDTAGVSRGGGGADADAVEGDRRRELMERQNRKSDAEKKRTRMATRGGRIVTIWPGAGLAGEGRPRNDSND